MTDERIIQSTPLLPVAVCLMGGIWAGYACDSSLPAWLLLPVALAAIVLCRRWPAVQSVLIGGGWLAVGLCLAQCQPERTLADGTTVEAVVMSEPAEKPKTIAADLLVPGEGGLTVRCYLWKDERSRQLRIGDRLTIDDWQGTFVRSHQWRAGGNAHAQMSRWQRTRLRFLLLRHRLLARYQTQEADEAAYGVLAAMTLGDKSALTPELRETYSVSGASHVLALSGLHLGIIYLLLSRLTLSRRRHWVSQAVVVLAVWAFALLTGLSPSIMRSALMISLFAVFSLRSHGRASVNILCLTAIVMLLADAHTLGDIGFQLSFAAVLAILVLMPLAERLCQPRHPLMRWAWSLMAVSLCAQIGVAPLVAYHFGHFPTYFLLTNFLVIPAATVILYGALLTLAVPAAGPLLMKLTGQLNDALGAIAKLPCASVDGLHPSVSQVCLIYAVTGLLCWATYSLTSARCRSGLPQS